MAAIIAVLRGDPPVLDNSSTAAVRTVNVEFAISVRSVAEDAMTLHCCYIIFFSFEEIWTHSFGEIMRLFCAIVCAVLLANPSATQAKRLTGKMTWYSRKDNNSNRGSRDNKLKVFKSVATKHGSRVPFGTRIHIPMLVGFPISRDVQHDGWVRVDDTCRGASCKFLDLYVGSESQKRKYMRWITNTFHQDPGVLPIVAYIS